MEQQNDLGYIAEKNRKPISSVLFFLDYVFVYISKNKCTNCQFTRLENCSRRLLKTQRRHIVI